MQDILKTIGNIGIVPVVVIKNANKAEGLAKALVEGGVPCAEVTFRTGAAQEAIEKMAKAYPEVILGAGTILTVEQAQRAVDAGAKFLVSPGYDQVLVDWTRSHNVPYVPGVCTASEVQVAVANGFEVLKFFPAEAAGGVPMIKNLCGPFPQVKFMTTGGISTDNIQPYATCANVLAVGGSWMVKSDLIEAENWEAIKTKCHEAISALHGFAFKGLVRACSAKQASAIHDALAPFGLGLSASLSNSLSSKSDIFTTSEGEKDKLIISTYNLDRAASYLEYYGYKCIKCNNVLNSDMCYNLQPNVEDYGIVLMQTK